MVLEDSPDRKRQRTSEEDEELEQLLQGDDFITDEQRQEQLAKERRLARKNRLKATNSRVQEQNGQLQKDDELQDRRQQATGDGNVITTAEEEDAKEGKALEGSDDDDFDMFSSSVSPVLDGPPASHAKASAKNSNVDNPDNVDQQQDWDDAEGYYKASIGEIFNLELASSSSNIQFRVSGVIGKGVFSTVLKCSTESSNTSTPLPPQVALKCIRHNDTMAKAAHNEIRFLQRITSSPGIIPLLLPTNNIPLEHRGHIVLVFPYLEYNLRDVLSKFGKGVGLSLTAVRSYFGQLLAAATHLKNHHLIHSDLKPDNM
jgi:serine/threonine-protein kinase PRP4